MEIQQANQSCPVLFIGVGVQVYTANIEADAVAAEDTFAFSDQTFSEETFSD
jgi:hypothetical protein